MDEGSQVKQTVYFKTNLIIERRSSMKREASQKETVRIGLIGIGLIGKKHAETLMKIKEGTLVAISDIDANFQKTSEELGAKFYLHYEEMIDKEKLHGVLIAVPNELHVPVGTTCAKKGLHLFIEKPIATDLSGADQLIAAAKQNNVRILVGHHRRFNPLIEVTRKIVREGQVGELVGVMIQMATLKSSDYFQVTWRKSKGGGPILNNLIHDIDNLRYICGEIRRVYAEVSNKVRKFPVEDSASVALRFENDALGNILVSDCVPSVYAYESTTKENPFYFHVKENCYYFFGTEASLVFPQLKKRYYPRPDKAGWQYPIIEENIKVVRSDPYLKQLRHFCKVCTGEEFHVHQVKTEEKHWK